MSRIIQPVNYNEIFWTLANEFVAKSISTHTNINFKILIHLCDHNLFTVSQQRKIFCHEQVDDLYYRTLFQHNFQCHLKKFYRKKNARLFAKVLFFFYYFWFNSIFKKCHFQFVTMLWYLLCHYVTIRHNISNFPVLTFSVIFCLRRKLVTQY